MVIKIGINGFGRLSRVIFRACIESDEFEVTAINDPVIEADYICYLIKFDSSHGNFKGTVTNTDKDVFVDGKQIKIFNIKQPSRIPWHKARVRYVVESSGLYTSMSKASEHLYSSGVKTVFVTAPSNDIPMVILGVNEHELKKDPKVVSCTSSTLYCLAPIMKILDTNYGVAEAFVTSIHAMTPSLKPIDGVCVKGKQCWRDHRSITQNIIPANTSACMALGKVMPQVRDKMCGLAFRVPVANVSVLDISVRLCKKTSLEDILKKVECAVEMQQNDIIKISRDFEVSSDFMGSKHSCIVDAKTCKQLKPNFYKIICWYENEYSYALRVIDTMRYLTKHPTNNHCAHSKIIVPYLRTCNTDKGRNTIVCDNTLRKATTFPMLLKKLAKRTQHSSNLSTHNKRMKNSELVRIRVTNKVEKSLDTDILKSKRILAQCPYDAKNRHRAHDRLQKLKEEFRKMVSKTEDLLKKSYNNKFKSNTVSLTISEDEEIDMNLEKQPDIGNGDFMDTINNSEIDLANLAEVSINLLSVQYVSISKENNSAQSESDNIIDMLETEQVNTIYWNEDKKESLQSIATNKNSEIVVKPNNAIIPAAYANYFKGNPTDYISPLNVKKKDKHIEILVEIPKFECLHNNTQVIAHSKLDRKNSLTQYTFSNGKFRFKQISNESLTDPFGMSNDVSMDLNKNVESDVQSSSQVSNQSEDVEDIIINKAERETVVHNYENINEMIIYPSNTKFEYDSRRYLEPKEQSDIHDDIERNKTDIYDKLESRSSEASFKTLEIKSQIISVTDLSNSIDDLKRLDKICKIIEISDDLSDRLFLPLKDSNIKTRKKWSFKDLCEKIKIDDFFEDAFGEPQLSAIT